MAFAALLAAGAGAAAAETPALSADALFYRGNDAYREGRYDEAAASYERVLELGQESGALYYNLGNARVKQDRLGEALWAYLNAATLLPRDADVYVNLSYVKDALSGARQASVDAPRIVRWLTAGGRFTVRELAWAWLALGWALVACRIAACWWTAARPIGRPLLWLCAASWLAVATMLAAQTGWVGGAGRGVVVAQGAAVKFAPQDSGTDHFTLPEGAVVRVIGQQAGWWQVRRGDGRAGWVRAEALRRL